MKREAFAKVRIPYRGGENHARLRRNGFEIDVPFIRCYKFCRFLCARMPVLRGGPEC